MKEFIIGRLALEEIPEGTLQMERKIILSQTETKIQEGIKSNGKSKYVRKYT